MLPYNLRTKVAPSEGRPSLGSLSTLGTKGDRAGGAGSPKAIYRPNSSNEAFGPMGAKASCMHAPDLATLAHLVRAPQLLIIPHLGVSREQEHKLSVCDTARGSLYGVC